MQFRPNITRAQEAKQIIMADLALTVAFAIAIGGGIFGGLHDVVILLPIAFVAVSLSFVLHELMHKFVAQHYGAIAAFQTSRTGLLITLGTSLFGFLFGIPGATVIYTNSFSVRQNGITSLAGPLTNFAVFAVFFPLYLISPANTYIQLLAEFVMFISILLAFFNMLPIMPLDGAKVIHWNRRIYYSTLGVIFILMAVAYELLFKSVAGMVTEIIFMLFIAVFFSMFYRNVL
ncbi:MAG: site-2 protease family protein [Candidatus Marsarchaeota archaeon]|nr:site-2 protease family protein [Candidatus Marsarchaeota archaeon]MCL5101788.1 site-2 protease family protein [Candidatus Marsarchaeota archaeon]